MPGKRAGYRVVLGVAVAVVAVSAAEPGLASGHVRLSRLRPTAYVVNAGSNWVTPVSLGTGRAGRPIRIGLVKGDRVPDGIIMARRGTAVYVTMGTGGLTPILTAGNKPGRPIRAGRMEHGVVIAPQATTAYVAGPFAVVPVDLRTGKPGRPIQVAGRGGCYSIYDVVIGPDGKTLYVACGTEIVPVSTRTRAVGKPIPVPAEGGTQLYDQVAVTPDSKTIFVSVTAGNVAAAISARTGKIRKVFTIGRAGAGVVDAFAIAPDGRTAYLADFGDDTIVPVTIATLTAGQPITIGPPGRHDQGPTFIAITPDSKTAYVSTPAAVYPVTLASGKVGKPIRTAPRGYSPTASQVTPDGRTLWVISDGSNTFTNFNVTGYLTRISVATNTAGKPVRAGRDPFCLLIAARPAPNLTGACGGGASFTY